MIAHTSLHISDYSKAKAFYSKILATLGYRNNMEYGEAAGFNDGKNTDFWISKKTSVVPTHLAFVANSRQEVEAFHKAALAAGGKDNGGPGYHQGTTPRSCLTGTATILKRSGTTSANRKRSI
jgi:predicted lactoylglutathione lyase